MRSPDEEVIALAAVLIGSQDLRPLEAQVVSGTVSADLARDVLGAVNDYDCHDFVEKVLTGMTP